MKDVLEAFKLPHLHKLLLHKDSSYIYSTHYKYFIIEKSIQKEKNKTKKYMFLTYIYIYIYITNAENDINLLMKSLNINVKYENYNELIILNKDLFNIVQNYYEQIGKKYAGHISELISKIKDLEHELDKQNIEK